MATGYLYGEGVPTEKCPYCREVCYADFIDIGVGMTQCGPYYCEGCGATEIGSYDNRSGMTEIERKLGWWSPEHGPGSSANVIGGKVVGHAEMLDAYRTAFVNNPIYDEPGVVQQWFQDVRGSKPGQETISRYRKAPPKQSLTG